MALAKLQITVVHTGDVITAQFNPEEYTVNRENSIAQQSVPGLSGPILQFTNGNLQTLDLELFFDTWDTDQAQKKDVRELTDQVVNLLEIDKELHAPPVLEVRWGSLDFVCLLAKANQKFQMFTDEGVPVRARVTVSFSRYLDPEREAKAVNRQTADFSKFHAVVEGQTLAAISALYYDDPRLWRPIALANALTDPRDLTPGQALRIPSLPYHSPETGEVVR